MCGSAPAAASGGPLSGVDLDESPGAIPVADQLSIALCSNAACIIDLFVELDVDQNGTISFEEFAAGLKSLGLAVPTLYMKLLFKFFDKEYALVAEGGDLALEIIDPRLRVYTRSARRRDHRAHRRRVHQVFHGGSHASTQLWIRVVRMPRRRDARTRCSFVHM